MRPWPDLGGLNAGYVEELFERYRRDPGAVDDATRAYFERSASIASDGSLAVPSATVAAALRLAEAVRRYGHLDAALDPLDGTLAGAPDLSLETHGLTEDDLRLLPADVVGGPIAREVQNALEAIRALRRIYAGRTGYEFDHVGTREEREWFTEAVESQRYARTDQADAEAMLERLTEVEAFEQFLHRVFPGRTRFSIEGLDMLVPMLDELIAAAARGENVMIGMAHRGRLNVLAHILQKPYEQILAEFKDPIQGRSFREDLGWTGDVKYHKGARLDPGVTETPGIVVIMPPNPSHVEAVDPIVVGMARAAGTTADHPGPPRFDPDLTVAILIHGDAAFVGQGVVAETLNLSRLPGYTVGGTLHIIANNQLGYTTFPGEGRSTRYASDLAKGFEIPVVHVNADDPEACLAAVRLAVAYRERFRKDLVIDLVGYRRYGHNEGDEPTFTHPTMYTTIQDHPSVRALWAHTLVERGQIAEGRPEELIKQRLGELEQALKSLRPEIEVVDARAVPPPPGAAQRARTAVSVEQLTGHFEAFLRIPEGFTPHPKLARALQRRREALRDPNAPAVDWATAEMLAFASVLADGTAIRLTGQDTERGTFSQRHAVFHDRKTGNRYIPLQALPTAQASFEVHNSPLSENAPLAYEYGYSIQAPRRLVIWEAQYGDFINGAQAVVDEFIVSARAKWGQTPSLVLLLPHGHEGQGPDHSSGRVERFLQLATELNIRVANCTTAGQYFHLLRRQALLLRTDPLPLIVMTPKGLLRHPLAASSLRDLAEGGWEPVIDGDQAHRRATEVRRLVLCSGRIFTDLVGARGDRELPLAIVRVEQLYPFPDDALRAVLDSYPRLREILWVQEEPQNMGAWPYVQPLLREIAGGRWSVTYVGRPSNASPAEGSAAWHQRNQSAIVAQALGAAGERNGGPVMARQADRAED